MTPPSCIVSTMHLRLRPVTRRGSRALALSVATMLLAMVGMHALVGANSHCDPAVNDGSGQVVGEDGTSGETLGAHSGHTATHNVEPTTKFPMLGTRPLASATANGEHPSGVVAGAFLGLCCIAVLVGLVALLLPGLRRRHLLNRTSIRLKAARIAERHFPLRQVSIFQLSVLRL